MRQHKKTIIALLLGLTGLSGILGAALDIEVMQIVAGLSGLVLLPTFILGYFVKEIVRNIRERGLRAVIALVAVTATPFVLPDLLPALVRFVDEHSAVLAVIFALEVLALIGGVIYWIVRVPGHQLKVGTRRDLLGLSNMDPTDPMSPMNPGQDLNPASPWYGISERH